MSVGEVQATFASTLVDEWVRGGVAHAAVCPGSRSTPLALALSRAAREGRLSLNVVLDERVAGFWALGVGRATGRPAVVVTTSGTAAAELHPAVVEAHHGRVPLIACTADRPPELHHVGAPQTIEQVGLYAGALRWEVSPGVPDPGEAASWRSLGSRLVAEACSGPAGPGPVHANLAFREPLVGEAGELPPGRPGGAPWHRVARPAPQAPAGLVQEVAGWAGRRGVVVAGAGAGPQEAVHAMAEALGWPVLACPRSGARRPRKTTVAAADALLRDPGFASHHRPEAVVRLGEPWASRVVGEWCGGLGEDVDQVVVGEGWAWADPGRVASVVAEAEPGSFCRAVAARVGRRPAEGWLASWADAEAGAQEAISGVLDEHPEPTEPGVARAVMASVPAEGTLVVASSMPVRDLEWYGPALEAPARVLANRGANGIDGTLATALGVAAATPRGVVALVGDLAFLHDAGALAGAGAAGVVVVVVDNGGGGIFSFLPQARMLGGEEFELLFGTRPRVDVGEVAAGYGLNVVEVEEAAGVGRALRRALERGRAEVVRVRTDRAANVAVHAELHRAVAGAIRERGERGWC